MATVNKRRIDTDVLKLIQNKHEVENIGPNEYAVMFHGPPYSVYKGGIWKVRVRLGKDYPFRSPSIGFMNRIYHPNIDEHSGSICLNVLNETWTPIYDLVNIFEQFLPQLLSYPNPCDPLNSEAAMSFLVQPENYKKKIQDHIKIYATKEALLRLKDNHSDTDSESSSSNDSGIENNTNVANQK